MTAEEAETLWWQELTKWDWHESSGKPDLQKTMRIQAMTALLAAIRKDYQEENERLRQRVRDLEEVVARSMERAAEPA